MLEKNYNIMELIAFIYYFMRNKSFKLIFSICLLGSMFTLSGCETIMDFFNPASIKSDINLDRGISYYKTGIAHNKKLAIKCFKDSNSPAAAGYIIKALEDEDSQVRAEAIDALVQKEGSKSADHIINCLSDSEKINVVKAETYIKAFGKQAEDIIRDKLKSNNFDEKFNAIKAMGLINEDSFIDILGRFVIDDKDYRLRIEAITSLAKKDDLTASVYIMKAFKDRVPKVRIAALDSIQKTGSIDVVNQVLPSLKDGNQDVVLAAIRALGDNKNDMAVEPLIKKLVNSNADSHIVDEITKALTKLGSERTIYLYTDCLYDNNQFVRFAVLKAAINAKQQKWANDVILEALENDMSEIKNMALFAVSSKQTAPRENIESIAQALYDEDPTVRMNAVYALSKLPQQQQYREYYLDLLEDESIRVRLATIKALPRLNDPWTIEILQQIIAKSKDEDVLVTAIQTLGQYKNQPQITGLLGDLLANKNYQLANAASTSLITMGGIGARAEFIKKLRDDSPQVRVRALKGLEQLGDYASIGSIQRLLSDPDRNVRQTAQKTLQIIEKRKAVNIKYKSSLKKNNN